MINLNKLVRENILNLQPYASARDDYSALDGIFLDANENPYGNLNRYPDPYQKKLKSLLGEQRKVNENSIFIGNGSDEIIDILFRIFCIPGKDKALTFAPTYGMYQVSAGINNVEIIKIPLNDQFDIDLEKILPYINDESLKLILICSPNNPTGNHLGAQAITAILEMFSGIVVIDEAYIDFSTRESAIGLLKQFDNLVVTQTMSKAWGLAATRVGIAFTNPPIIQLMNKVKPPYNVSSLNQQAAIDALLNPALFEANKSLILSEKEKLSSALSDLEIVKKVYPSEANFFLVKVEDAERVYNLLVAENIIVRNRHKVIENCLRITIGTPEENAKLIATLKQIK